MHIAATMGTPVVATFGPTYPQRWGPRGGPAQVIYKGLDCRACYHPTCLRGDDSCMQQITVDEVFTAASRMLERTPARSRDMSDELVSVVIPVFNGAPFVAKAVASVRAQGHGAVEILVVDDGSTDGTQEVLNRLEQSDGIRWFQRSHGGPARSRNYGIAAAQGQFIALLDCDDDWLPGKLAAQLAIMRARPDVGLVHTDFEVRFEDGTLEERVSARSSREPMVQAFAGGHVALPSTLLIRKISARSDRESGSRTVRVGRLRSHDPAVSGDQVRVHR